MPIPTPEYERTLDDQLRAKRARLVVAATTLALLLAVVGLGPIHSY